MYYQIFESLLCTQVPHCVSELGDVHINPGSQYSTGHPFGIA